MFSVIAIKAAIFISLLFAILKFFNKNSFSQTERELFINFSLIVNDKKNINFSKMSIVKYMLSIQ